MTLGSGGYISQAIAVADLNHDGKQDVIVADWWDPSTLQGVVGVLLGERRRWLSAGGDLQYGRTS